jgi:hypothetical protein
MMADPRPTYRLEPKKSNTTTTLRKVGYALRSKDERQRAAVAAMLVNGTIPPSPPSVRTAARICCTSPYLVRRALLNGGGHNGRNGRRGNGNAKAVTLAQHLLGATDAERLGAAQHLGPSWLWDALIEPVLSEEDRRTKVAK